VALVERGDDRTAVVAVVPGDRIVEREPALLATARSLLPRLPFADADVLLVDRIGKDVSGTGIDTNVVGRKLAAPDPSLHIRHVVVRGLTEATGGNALGLGFADLCRRRVVERLDPVALRVNAVTAANLGAARVPLTAATDAELLDVALPLIGLRPPESARIQWIRDTAHLERVACSVTYLDDAAGRDDLAAIERYELGVLEAYLPAKMDEAAIQAAIDAAKAETGAAGPADMGKLMGVLKPKLAGQADMGLVSQLVKKKLAG